MKCSSEADNFPRYHSKCLKIARGKMKEFDAFTCPICDWRVKIPRDAARPKLEDLQNWADEIPNLPFQPEEEDILKRIVSKAQAFRDFLQQFTNGNQICRTSEEMPTMLFYLRKLEGAEVLLAYETNSFRQELHKWQPIAPEPPPVLQQSLSTRKPRPTKLQKTMKEMGVEKVEDLPPHLRTKTIVKRKSTDPSVNGTPRPPPLQPAQMQRDSSGPGQVQGQQAGTRSDTPTGVPRQASTGNAPGNGHYNANHLTMSMAPSPTYGHPFAASGPPSYPPSTPSPMFSPVSSLPPNGLRDPMMASRFPGGPSAGPNPHDLFSPEFNIGMDPEDDIRTGLANGGSAAAEPNDMSSPHTGNVDEMFMQMTNQDPDTQNDAPPGLEAEASQASEALEMIRGASNASVASRTRDGDECAIDPEKGGFDEFFEDGDAQT
jgi:[histone H3]-trimethyl-L-lysine4 demethylase